MSTENDTSTGGGEMSLDEAASAYAKLSQPDAAPQGQAEDEDADTGETTDDELEADAEGEDEGETTDEDGQADEPEDENEPDSEQGRFVAENGKVKLPDGTVATVADLVAGNLRDRDYRQKTMEVAEQRRSVESQSSLIKQQETQLEEQRTFVVQAFQSIMPPPPDPGLVDPQSPNYNPAAYLKQEADHRQFLALMQNLEAQSGQTKAQREAEAKAAKDAKGNAELATLIDKVPAFKDQTRFAGFINDVREFGQKYGFSTAELQDGIGYDHRMAMVMHKAIQWDKLQASKPKAQAKVEGRPPIQKSGKRLSPDAARAKSASVAMDRLKQTGSVNDAVAVYLARQQKG